MKGIASREHFIWKTGSLFYVEPKKFLPQFLANNSSEKAGEQCTPKQNISPIRKFILAFQLAF
jgi:hypothetical protein